MSKRSLVGPSDEESIIVASEPQRLGRFELIARLGTGGFAETYLARYRGADDFVKDVCVKRVFPEKAGDPDYTEPLRDEAVIMAALSHPNIVKVQEYVNTGGHHFIVMQYVDGVSLAEMSKFLRQAKEPFPRHLALYAMYRVLRALDAAHRLVLHGEEQHVIHRDINPKNVLVERSGVPYLIDFGLVKAKHRKYRTQTGFLRGTIPYTAPETIMKGVPETHVQEDARTDVYAVGVCLYELLVGKHPFVRGVAREDQIASAVVAGRHIKLTEQPLELPDGLADLVERMMAVDMTKRPTTALEACELLCPYVFADGDPLAELRAERELGELVQRVVGHRPSRATGYERPRDVDTATRLRERPADAADKVRGSGIQEKPAATVLPLTQRQPLPTTATLATPTPPQSVRRGPGKWLAMGVIAAGMFIAAALALRGEVVHKPSNARQQVVSKQVAPAKPQESASGATPSLAAPVPREPAEVALPSPPIAPQPNIQAETRAAPEKPATRKQDVAPEPAETPTSERTAWLDVKVTPNDRDWQVWVDGQYYGSADVKVKVAPGKHTVEVGLGRPTSKRSVRVSPKATREVSFEL